MTAFELSKPVPFFFECSYPFCVPRCPGPNCSILATSVTTVVGLRPSTATRTCPSRFKFPSGASGLSTPFPEGPSFSLLDLLFPG